MPDTATETAPPITTRRPTGKPPWPLILLAGVEKAGKSWSAAAFSASDLIDRTFWIEIGEGAADQYGAIPGARYEIVEHDGTYQGIGRAIWAAQRQPRPDGKPHAIVIDSVTELWELVCSEQQEKANRKRAGRQPNSRFEDDATITMDQWNAAKKRWRAIIDMLRVYDGPVILTARLESVTVMGEGGQPAKGRDGKPTGEKQWKVRGEKNLGFEVDVIVEMTAVRKCELVGVRSVYLEMPEDGRKAYPEFSIDRLLRDMGLDAIAATSPRSYTAPNAEAYLDEDDRAPTTDEPARTQAVTDTAWATGWRERVTGCAVESELRGLWAEFVSQVNAGQVAPQDAPGLEAHCKTRAGELKASTDQTPLPSEPAAPPETPGDIPPNVTARMHALFAEVGWAADRDDRLRATSAILRRPVGSSSELTASEAQTVVNVLAVAAKDNDAQGHVGRIVEEYAGAAGVAA